MTKQLLCDERDYIDRDQVEAEHHAAAEIIDDDGGWVVFYDAEDARLWHNQA